MKRSSVILSLVVALFAVAGAFASNVTGSSMTVQGYAKPHCGTLANVDQVDDPCNSTGPACTINGNDAYSISGDCSTQSGSLMRKVQ